jgi:hypothetical protein
MTPILLGVATAAAADRASAGRAAADRAIERSAVGVNMVLVYKSFARSQLMLRLSVVQMDELLVGLVC